MCVIFWNESNSSIGLDWGIFCNWCVFLGRGIHGGGLEQPLEESLILQVCVEETSNLPKIQRSPVPPIKLTFCLCQSNCLCRFFAFIFAFDFVFVFKETTILPQFNGACQSLQLNLHSQFPYLSSSLSFLSFSLEDIVLTFVTRIYYSIFTFQYQSCCTRGNNFSSLQTLAIVHQFLKLRKYEYCAKATKVMTELFLEDSEFLFLAISVISYQTRLLRVSQNRLQSLKYSDINISRACVVRGEL